MSIRIMIVDDSMVSQSEMSRMLERSGIEIVGTCRSGEEALDAFEEIRPDVVTMDIILPGMDGLATASALLKRWPETPVIMVSSLAYEDTVRWSEELGARGVLFKPFQREALVEAILQAVQPVAQTRRDGE